jgi:hypothetical protein
MSPAVQPFRRTSLPVAGFAVAKWPPLEARYTSKRTGEQATVPQALGIERRLDQYIGSAEVALLRGSLDIKPDGVLCDAMLEVLTMEV